MVYRYDRFARSLRQLVNALCEFNELGIQFISLHEGVDTSTANGRLVFGSIAEFEPELIRERVRSSIAVARAQGKRIGRPRRSVDDGRRPSGRGCAARAGPGPRSHVRWAQAWVRCTGRCRDQVHQVHESILSRRCFQHSQS